MKLPQQVIEFLSDLGEYTVHTNLAHPMVCYTEASERAFMESVCKGQVFSDAFLIVTE